MGYYAGIDCQCNASVERDCSCANVDWTPTEVYKLRTEVAELREQLTQADKKITNICQVIKKCFPIPEACCDSALLAHMDNYNDLADVINKYYTNTTIDKGE